MIIQKRASEVLFTPETLLELTGATSDKYAIFNQSKSLLQLTEIQEDFLDPAWVQVEEDRRKMKKLKKALLNKIAEDKLESYKSTDLIQKQLSKTFINTSAISDVLKNALKNKMNLVIYGKGGYGKSEMITNLFSGPEFKDMVFVKSLSEATTEEDLFGGINIKKMTDTGVIEYNCENSFANKRIVVFEEMFDANPRVLAALKDTLTSKEIRNGSQRYPIKTEIIIALTNKTYEEVIIDDSTEALTQRFPLSFKLEYPLTQIDIAALALKRFPDIDPKKMMGIMEWANITPKDKITPRKAIELAKYLDGIDINPEKDYSEMVTNNNIEKAIKYVQKKASFNDEMLVLELKKAIEAQRGMIERKEKVDYDFVRDFDNKKAILDLKIEALMKIKAVCATTSEAKLEIAEPAPVKMESEGQRVAAQILKRRAKLKKAA